MCPNSADVSFIIPHRGRQDLLLMTLNSIVALETQGACIEIVVVTQDATLDDSELAQQICSGNHTVVGGFDGALNSSSVVKYGLGKDNDVSLRVLKSPTTDTISSLRNRGAKISTGHYLAFLDADIELSSNWLVAMRSALAVKLTRIIVSAVQAYPPQPKPLESVRVALSNKVVDANLQFLPGRNLFLERATFDTIGGFPERLATCEDYWFTDKASRLGELYYCSAASYIHLGEDKTYWQMAYKEIWRAQSNLFSLRYRRISLKESASFAVPLWVLAAMISLPHATILFGIPAFVVFVTAIILPVGLYSWRILRSSSRRLSVGAVLGFYLLYLPARGVGMLMGLAKEVINRAKMGKLFFQNMDKNES